MRMHMQLIVAAALSAACLAGLAGTAGADHMTLSNQEFRIVFPAEERLEGPDWECKVTITGSFHRSTFLKSVGALLGNVTGVTSEGCVFEAPATAVAFLTETLPWHVKYSFITGQLPEIETLGVEIIGARWSVTYLGGMFSCLYQSTTTSPVRGSFITEEERIIALTMDETTSIPKAVGGMLCPATSTLARSGGVFLTGTLNRIRLTLI